MADIAKRFAENPLLRPSNIAPSLEGMNVECLLNPGVFRFNDKTWLLLRVAERPEQSPGKTSFPLIADDGSFQILEFDNADPKLNLSDLRIISYDDKDYLTTMSHLRLVASEDGINFSEATSYPAMFGQGELETYGIEDCRVTQIGEIFYLTFTQVSAHGVGVGLRSTKDWQEFHKHGMILPPHNKDCAIFDERIGGKYYALHRPSSQFIGGNYIWLAESPDLVHWGQHRCLAHSRPGMWDCARVGAGAAPIRTPKGWLEIYHGADDQNRYCLGALLLDLEQPWNVLARSSEPIMEPIAEYERIGFFGNVVFTNGHLVTGDVLTIYYGASDSVICGARFSIEEILQTLS
ncbi:glycoside hydrolase family 130 protein [Bythopirellula polymerisocia]|uniref:Beta-1,4-mannooligosaccharide phosphorylase n=1 Tax=Bythopirellula polymerisocia TaxID=2528003 RepID=A0A5C6CUV2_9BACT|nr:glycoside hydrolase family 130 protein [Bythopirellula polymerisocia]TWU28350.1 Beta-1,4-mannooligosaccharide phosphorylase [Bythopirellula polymerisocia]